MITLTWSNEITLLAPEIDPSESVDENGYPIEPPYKRREVYCSKKNVGYSEYYKAQQQGQYARFKVDIYTAEYSGERLADFEGERYMILRTYELENGEITELTLSDIVAGTGV